MIKKKQKLHHNMKVKQKNSKISLHIKKSHKPKFNRIRVEDDPKLIRNSIEDNPNIHLSQGQLKTNLSSAPSNQRYSFSRPTKNCSSPRKFRNGNASIVVRSMVIWLQSAIHVSQRDLIEEFNIGSKVLPILKVF